MFRSKNTGKVHAKRGMKGMHILPLINPNNKSHFVWQDLRISSVQA